MKGVNSSEIVEHRIKKFTFKYMIQRIENNKLELRKNQVDDYLMFKRGVFTSENIYMIDPETCKIPKDMILNIPFFITNANFDFDFLGNYIYHSETNILKYGLCILRKYISSEDTDSCLPKVKIDDYLINRLASLLVYPDNFFEASWIIINLTNYLPSAVEYLSTENNINYVVEFFKFANEHLIEHAIWVMGNIAADSQFSRNHLTNYETIDKFNKLLDNFGTDFKIKEKVIWVLCNLCRGRIDQNHAFIDIIPTIIKYFNSTSDSNEIKQLLYVIMKLTSTTSIILDQFINKSILNRLTEIMYAHDQAIKSYCIKIIANLVSGTDIQTQYLINQGVIDVFRQLIEEKDFKILKEVLWGISNLCAGTVSQIERLFKNGIIWKLLEICSYLLPKYHEEKSIYESINKTLREGVFSICNVITGGLIFYRLQMLNYEKCDLLDLLIKSLEIFQAELRLIEAILLSIQCLIVLDDEDNYDQMMMNVDNAIRNKLLAMGLEEILYGFMESSNKMISELASEIYNNYK